jgi:hypothetical protein
LRTEKTCAPYLARIYIAGDYETALKTCRRFFFTRGGCVNVQRTEYVYTGGQESGVVVEVINYARFPQDEAHLDNLAMNLAETLRGELCQQSYSIVTPTESRFVSYRDDMNIS